MCFKRGCSFRSRRKRSVRKSNVGCQKFLVDANSVRRLAHTRRVIREIYERARSTRRGLTVDWLSKMGLARESRAISRVCLRAPFWMGLSKERLYYITCAHTRVTHTYRVIIHELTVRAFNKLPIVLRSFIECQRAERSRSGESGNSHSRRRNPPIIHCADPRKSAGKKRSSELKKQIKSEKKGERRAGQSGEGARANC